MGKCPYCNASLHIKDFFERNPQGLIRESYETKQETIFSLNYGKATMWVCPKCDKILGFSERDDSHH